MATTTMAARPAKRARPRLGRIAGIAGGILAILLVLGYLGMSAYVANKLTMPERNPVDSTPAAYGLVYEDVGFTSTVDNIPLRGWLIDSPGDKAIVMLHGQNQNRMRDEASLEKAALFTDNGYDVLMFDFRGHGESGGQRYAFGQWETRDLAGALRFLTDRGYTTIGTYAVSMGAAISLLAAPEQAEMRALWVDSPYGDLGSLVEQRLPESSGLPAIFNPGILTAGRVLYGLDVYSVKPAEALARLGDRPVYQVHSAEGDTLVPLDQTRLLEQAGAANPNFTSWIAPGAGHVQAYTNNKAEYTRRMLDFYARYLQ